jgi:hypothetical protein
MGANVTFQCVGRECVCVVVRDVVGLFELLPFSLLNITKCSSPAFLRKKVL